MSSLWTDVIDFSITGPAWNLTSDAFLSEFEEIELQPSMNWRPSGFSRWPIRMIENVTALEDADLLYPAPLAPDERSLGDSQVFFVTSRPPEESGHLFIRVTATTTTLSHILLQTTVEQIPRRSRFYPDFFTIKKFMGYVMGRTLTPPLKRQQPRQMRLKIPITVAPQVIHRADEENLTEDLKTALKFAEENYSTLKRIEVNIEYDPEIVDRKTIRFTLTVSGEPELVLKDELKFKENLYTALDIKTCEQITTTYKWKS